ncbi:serine protease [Candidatus Azambacteria bacterium]|nr:serine protease [Candidatus Azambacteria bacterium]
MPSEIRKRGPVDVSYEWYLLKTVGLAVLFGFFSGFVGGIVVNTRLGEDFLWGPNSKVREYFSTSEAEHTILSRETLTQKALATTVGIYRASAIVGVTAPRTEDRLASAFFLTADGYLATTSPHIRSVSFKDLVVVTGNARVYKIESLVADTATDLTILKIKGLNFDVLPFVNNDRIDPGAFAWVVSPGEGLMPSEVVAAAVTLSTKDRQPFSSDIPYRFAVLKNSVGAESVGTPLLNGKGEIVGVIAGNKNNRSIVRVGFLKSAFDRVLKNHKITRPSLGIHFYEASQTLNAQENTSYGVRGVVLAGDSARKLSGVDRKSPLAPLALKAGDRVLALNNESISAVRSLPDILFDYGPGDRVEITYVRGTEEGKTTITLGSLNN